MCHSFLKSILSVRGFRKATCLLLVCLSGSVCAERDPENPLILERPLDISFTEFRPYGYTDVDGSTKGSIVGLVKGLLDHMQLPYTMRSRPTARIYHQLKVGELDVFLGPMGVPSLQGHVWEVPLPEHLSVSLYLWRKLGTPEAIEVPDLQDQSLAIINGFTYRGLLEQLEDPEYAITLTRTSSHENALKMLVSGRTDYLLDYGAPIEALLPQYPNVKLLRHLVQSRRVGLIVSRKAQNSRKLYQTLGLAVSSERLQPFVETKVAGP